jgi:hypothetical protein
MNLGNKLAVGEAVDLGIDEAAVAETAFSGVTLPEPAAPAPVEAVAAEPVAAHAER